MKSLGDELLPSLAMVDGVLCVNQESTFGLSQYCSRLLLGPDRQGDDRAQGYVQSAADETDKAGREADLCPVVCRPQTEAHSINEIGTVLRMSAVLRH
jgi:hypothetical protein